MTIKGMTLAPELGVASLSHCHHAGCSNVYFRPYHVQFFSGNEAPSSRTICLYPLAEINVKLTSYPILHHETPLHLLQFPFGEIPFPLF